MEDPSLPIGAQGQKGNIRTLTLDGREGSKPEFLHLSRDMYNFVL